MQRWIRSVAKALGAAATLVGFASAASASATIDLIWARSGGSEDIGGTESSANTLRVIVTAGPGGVGGAAVSVDYSELPPDFEVLYYSATPSGPLPIEFGHPTKVGSRIENINAFSIGGVGTGLLAGQSHQLGTITFHYVELGDIIHTIRSDANGPTDVVWDWNANDITTTTTFNQAWRSGSGPPRVCELSIEVNAIRGGSPTVAVNTTKDITAKARIFKGTALPGTTLDATLRIDAMDGSELIDSQSSGPIRLEVGKGGNGDTLAMNVSQCDSGAIDFVATFFGLDANGDRCEASRRITKTCQ